jgi:hypothetical protein
MIELAADNEMGERREGTWSPCDFFAESQCAHNVSFII